MIAECLSTTGVPHLVVLSSGVLEAIRGFWHRAHGNDHHILDILIAAALENVITKDNAGKIKAKVIIELANGPTTPEADAILFQNKVHVIPDFLANAGGVAVSYFEMVQNISRYNWTLDEVYTRLDERMTVTYQAVLAALQSVQSKHASGSLHRSCVPCRRGHEDTRLGLDKIRSKPPTAAEVLCVSPGRRPVIGAQSCLLYTSDAADE